MRVCIAGGGSVGRFVATQLLESGHDVLIIDNDSSLVAREERSQQLADATWVVADACEVEALAAAGLDQIDVVAAVTSDDEDNLVISLLAKQSFGVPRVIARVNNPKNEWLFNEMWGVDVAVSTPHVLTALVQEAVSVGSFVRLMNLKDGRVRLAEVTLDEHSPADGKMIQELPLPRQATVVAVMRGEQVIVPRGDTTVRSGDEVIVLAADEAEDETRACFVSPR